MLTRKQHELLMFIHERIKETGVSPSFDEMKEALDLASKSGIHRLITALEERGFLRRLAHRARALEVVKLPQQATTAAPSEGPRRLQAPGRRAERAFAAAVAANDTRDLLDARPHRSRHARSRRSSTSATGSPCRKPSWALASTMCSRSQGDSMIQAGILDGDYVVIRRVNTANSGEIVVALVMGEEATLKRLRRKGASHRARGRQPRLRDPHLRARPGAGAGQAGGPHPPLPLNVQDRLVRVQGRWPRNG